MTTQKTLIELAQKIPCNNPNSFDITANNDNEFINQLANESLSIGGAPINVFKLLGVHEQGQLVDLTGSGTPISSGDAGSDFTSSNAFESNIAEWHSLQTGGDVITSTFIGYDFGPILLEYTNREKYGIDTREKNHITTIQIQQSCESTNRITKARVEYSRNGQKWYGSSIITLPDDDLLNTINLKTSAPARYWRIRPLEFNGGIGDFWAVKQLKLIDYQATSLTNLQDEFGFLEQRDRDYSTESIRLKAFYDLVDNQADLTRFGIHMTGQQYFLQIPFITMIQELGRPMVVGDIIEIPSETQYTSELVPVLKYVEVTDVTWSTEGYTPGWQPTMMRIVAQPVMASQETLDVIGDFAPDPDATGFLNINDSQHQNLTNINNKVEAQADTQTPINGADTTDIHVLPEESFEKAKEQGFNIDNLAYNERNLYVEDGLPPNGEQYTEGSTYPSTPNDGDYHRITYENSGYDIPPRLFKYSSVKGRWIYCETDRRLQYNGVKPLLNRFLSDPDARSIEDSEDDL